MTSSRFLASGYFCLWAVLAAAGQAGAQPFVPTETRIVRAWFDNDADAVKLIVSLEHLEVNWDEGYVVLSATDREIADVRAAGMRVEDDRSFVVVEQPVIQGVVSGASIPGYPCYRTVEETYAAARDLVARFPTLATWTDSGDSWKKTQKAGDGYDLMVLSLTNSRTSGTKPVLFITSALHAREYTTAELVIRFAEHLLDSYGVDADITWLLDHQRVDLIPMVNPDGRKRAEQGLSWRKNHNTNHCPGWTTRGRRPGVDLNRNFSFLWESTTGASPIECSNTYRGPSSASEPETRAVIAHLTSLFPDDRAGDGGADDTNAAPTTKSGLQLDIHSFSQLILYPWGHTTTAAPNGPALATLARKLARFNGYRPMQSIGLYPTTGHAGDYGYGALGVPSYTYELGTSFFQDCGSFNNSILPKNIESLLYAFKASRLPYLLPSGPDAVDVTASGDASTRGVTAGTAVTLAATIDDTRFNNSQGAEPTQNIAAAEYYVDSPPWASGATAIPMSAADGAFDGKSEAVTATIDTTGMAAGRHFLFVRGKDADDNWGPVSAAFLFVDGGLPDPPPMPTLAPAPEELHVSWASGNDNGSPITGYVIRHKPEARDWWTHVPVDHASTAEMTLSDLSPGPRLVGIRAVNGSGPSRWGASRRTVVPRLPQVSVTPGAPVAEGQTAGFSLKAVPAPTANLTVNLTIADTGDYAEAGATGAMSAVIGATGGGSHAVATIDDRVDEDDGAIKATLEAGSGYTVSSAEGSATVTVTDNDEPVVSVSGGAEIVEGAGASFTLTANPTPRADLKVAIAVSQQGDFVDSANLGAATVTIPTTGVATRGVATLNDKEDEANGWVRTTVRNGDDYSVASGAGVAEVVVNDDDAPPPATPEVRFDSSATLAGEADDGGHEVRISLSPAPSAKLAIGYKVSGTATRGSDYEVSGLTANAGTISVAAGAATASLTVSVTDDGLNEPEESAILAIEAGRNYSVGAPSVHRVTIDDDDEPVVGIVAGGPVREGRDAVFSLTARPAPHADLAVDVDVADTGSKVRPGRLGGWSASVGTNGRGWLRIPTINHASRESGGTVTATLLSGGGYAVSETAREASVSVVDDDGTAPPPPPPVGGPSPPPAPPPVGGPSPPPGPPPAAPPPGHPRAAFDVDAGCTGDPCRLRTGESTAFVDRSSGAATRRLWDFGDGRSSRSREPVHAWTSPGFYTVVLTVTDGAEKSIASRTFIVEASEPAGTCEPDAHALCLLDSRYVVAVDWWQSEGELRQAKVVHAGTNDSGLFRFFSRDNWEILIKVLDGCSLNDHVWVFGASTTDLGYTIRVTDTVTGVEKKYRNEPGVAAPAITDATAFPDGCRPP